MALNVNELDENEIKQYLTQHLRWTVIMPLPTANPASDPHYLYRPRPVVKACLNCGKPVA
jgi:hypothetical protein